MSQGSNDNVFGKTPFDQLSNPEKKAVVIRRYIDYARNINYTDEQIYANIDAIRYIPRNTKPLITFNEYAKMVGIHNKHYSIDNAEAIKAVTFCNVHNLNMDYKVGIPSSSVSQLPTRGNEHSKARENEHSEAPVREKSPEQHNPSASETPVGEKSPKPHNPSISEAPKPIDPDEFEKLKAQSNIKQQKLEETETQLSDMKIQIEALTKQSHADQKRISVLDSYLKNALEMADMHAETIHKMQQNDENKSGMTTANTSRFQTPFDQQAYNEPDDIIFSPSVIDKQMPATKKNDTDANLEPQPAQSTPQKQNTNAQVPITEAQQRQTQHGEGVFARFNPFRRTNKYTMSEDDFDRVIEEYYTTHAMAGTAEAQQRTIRAHAIALQQIKDTETDKHFAILADQLPTTRHLRIGRNPDPLPIKHQQINDLLPMHLRRMNTQGTGRNSINIPQRIDLSRLGRYLI